MVLNRHMDPALIIMDNSNLNQKTQSGSDSDHNTNEISSSPSHQLIQSACCYCRESFGLLVTCGPLQYLAHIACRNSQICRYCGNPGMTADCADCVCFKVAHPWCAQRNRSVPQTSSSLPDIKQVLTQATQDPQLTAALRKYEIKQGKSKRCSGNALWYHIGTQYFPSTADLDAWPDLSAGRLSCEEQIQLIGGKWEPGLDLEGQISALTGELERTQATIQELQKEAKPLPRQCEIPPRHSDSHLILDELQLLKYAGVRKEFETYLQSRQRNPTSPYPPIDQEGPKKEFNCGVCGGASSEEENLIVICAMCEDCTHMKCYGLTDLPEGDWVCDMCTFFQRPVTKELRCALCPVVGGMMKETTHPHHPKAVQPLNPPRQWCHIFCAWFVTGVKIKENSDGSRLYNLSNVALQPWLRCEICGTCTNAHVQCSAEGCQFTFHPGCGKQFLISDWKNGPDTSSAVFCGVHKPVPLIDKVRQAKKQKIQAVIDFYHYWKETGPIVAASVCKRYRPWESHEVDALEAAIQTRLLSVSAKQSKSFKINLSLKNRKKPGVLCIGPALFNLMAPKALAKETVSIEKRGAAECVSYYTDFLLFGIAGVSSAYIASHRKFNRWYIREDVSPGQILDRNRN